LEDCTKIPCFIGDKILKVNTRHIFEWCRKNIVQNQVEMKKKWMVKIGHPMQLYTKSYKIHLFLGKKKSLVFGTILNLVVFCTPYMN
jgi:hypothetical protein